jgi:hypothetical protein
MSNLEILGEKKRGLTDLVVHFKKGGNTRKPYDNRLTSFAPFYTFFDHHYLILFCIVKRNQLY